MGKDSNSAHSYNVTCYNNLKNQPSGQLKRTVVKRSTEDVKRNRLRLRVTIDIVRMLAFQTCAFRGHDESTDSKNRGFLEMVKLLAEYDDEVKAVVLGNALGNAKYTSPMIQKEILDIMASKI
jgi:hypothetical protein